MTRCALPHRRQWPESTPSISRIALPGFAEETVSKKVLHTARLQAKEGKRRGKGMSPLLSRKWHRFAERQKRTWLWIRFSPTRIWHIKKSRICIPELERCDQCEAHRVG